MEGLSVAIKKAELACDACRLLKVRCIRDRANSHTCQKYSRSGIQCTWQTRQSRTRKSSLPSSGERITALEARIDQLLTVIEEEGPTPAHIPGESKHHAIQVHATPDSQYIKIDDNYFFDSLAARFQLSVDMAEVYLRHFRSMALYFPFIIIPDSTKVQKLSRESPMHLLAALTVSATQDPELQAGLEGMLRSGKIY